MEKEKLDYMSAEELRNRLYHSLRDRGMVDSIKTQLRNSLVKELQQTTKGKLTGSEQRSAEEGSLLHRASNSLVADHLKNCKYDYSLSVFLPESGTARDKIFTTYDLLQILHISPHSRLYRKMASAEPGRKGFLWQLLSEISALHANSIQECGVQTDLIKMGPISSLDEKLDGVEEFYSSQREENYRVGATAMEERLMSFQRTLEERYRTDLKLEVARIKDNESSRIRLEERDKLQREYDQQRRELERSYQQKSEALLQKERNSIERLQREQDIQEKEVFAQRQSLLSEIEVVRKREADVKREAEIIHREKRLEEQRIKDKESDLRRREHDVKRLETEYEQKLQNEMTKFKVEEQAKFLERSQNLEIRERRVKDEERRVRDEQERIQGMRDEMKDKTIRITELETRLQEEKHGEVSAMQQNELLNAKLRDMADYKHLKEQNAVQRTELETLRTRLAELLQMNERERGRQEEMIRELRRPTPETLMLQRELEKTKESLRQELTLSEANKQQLEKRLQEEMDRNRDLLRRFEDQTNQMKEMNQELVDLRAQLSITHQALSNEVYKKPQEKEGPKRFHTSLHSAQPVIEDSDDEGDEFLNLPGGEFRNKSPSPRRSARPRYEDNDVYNDVAIDLDLPSSGKKRIYPAFSEEDVSSVNSADVVAEAKYRLRSLEKEAQNLESAYRDFHYNLTNPSAGAERSRSPQRSRAKSPEHVPENKGTSSQHRVPSPAASPIHRPMSSTPYQGRPTANGLDDSLHELTSSDRKERPPQFNLSTMSDEGKKDHRVEERPRPITVSDLEARPGSPSIVVVPGSRSSDDDVTPSEPEKVVKDVHLDTTPRADFSPLVDVTPKRPPPGGKLAPISLDSAWKSSPSDDKEEDKKKEEEERRKKDEEEELRKWEEERQRKEEERKQREKEAWEREQRELQKLEEGRDTVDGADAAEVKDKGMGDLEIDPVMQQYMAMVQQQKDKEDETTKRVVDTWSKGHTRIVQETPSQSEVSVAEDIQGNDSDDDFGW
ncbi:hypothetical protein FSP39_020439 [Pinctada imbricata]|uniref:Oral-facial-digital syndrome 1 n=1 Tax=Pinctada imbricata TaxID=66713 RepID=A0AA89BZU5_PINIB|nr:hypothetical protein FSP39_020439 [Pinctada imbricata]